MTTYHYVSLPSCFTIIFLARLRLFFLSLSTSGSFSVHGFSRKNVLVQTCVRELRVQVKIWVISIIIFFHCLSLPFSLVFSIPLTFSPSLPLSLSLSLFLSFFFSRSMILLSLKKLLNVFFHHLILYLSLYHTHTNVYALSMAIFGLPPFSKLPLFC